MKIFYTPRPWKRQKQFGVQQGALEPATWIRSRYKRSYEDMRTSMCDGCSGRFAETDGPVHDYLTVSAGCWARFGQALALHYSDHRYWPAHQLLTDAYVLQHSQGAGLRSIRSVHVHLAALYAQLCLGQAEVRIVALRRALSEFDFKPLGRAWPRSSQSIAIVDLSVPDRHLSTTKDYAWSVLEDWEPYHELADGLCRV